MHCTCYTFSLDNVLHWPGPLVRDFTVSVNPMPAVTVRFYGRSFMVYSTSAVTVVCWLAFKTTN